jgi:hypothetical protein
MAQMARRDAVPAPSAQSGPASGEGDALARAMRCAAVRPGRAPATQDRAAVTPTRDGHELHVIRGNPSLVRDPSPSPPAATGPAAGVPAEQSRGAPAAPLPKSATPSVEEVAALVASGLTDAQLGRHFGRGDGWAYKFRRRHGIASARPRPAPSPDRDAVDAANRAYGVQLPSPQSEARVAAFFRRQRRRYEDVPASELAREQQREARSRSRDVTAAVFGDPPPGRVAAVKRRLS